MKLSKSKLALAKVINESGGWPQDSEWAVQNGDHGRISFSINKPVRHDSKSWMAKGGFNFKIEVCKPLKNWHQCVLNREEYYQAFPRDDADGWIDHNGKSNPVGEMDVVDVLFCNGLTSMSMCAGKWNWSWGGKSSASCFLIEKYRLNKPEVKPEFCESVMRSIPEPKPFKCAYDPKLTSPANVRIVDESIGDLCAKVTEENKHQHIEEKPTIEQLAEDYRNKMDYADRKQQEADEAKAAADAALGELERAGEALGLLIGIVKPEPELAITDWRDLRVGDEIECVGYGHPHTIGVVEMFDEISVDQNISVRHQNGDASWPRLWKFIRRP